jgi:hypothetical protein
MVDTDPVAVSSMDREMEREDLWRESEVNSKLQVQNRTSQKFQRTVIKYFPIDL